MTRKQEFVINTIQPYLDDHSKCAIYKGECVYLAPDGRKCALGKWLREEISQSVRDSIMDASSLFSYYDGDDALVPEARGILSEREWQDVQVMHDAYANANVEEPDMSELYPQSLFRTYRVIEDKLEHFGLTLTVNPEDENKRILTIR